MDTLTYSECFCKVYVEILKTLHPYLKFHTVIKGNRTNRSDCIIVGQRKNQSLGSVQTFRGIQGDNECHGEWKEMK